MRISRVVIQRMKALVQRDDSFSLDPGGAPASSVCLRGLNGSGKTTYLEAIASLWRLFRRWSQRGTHVRLASNDPLLSADLAALHVVGLPGPAGELWLVYGQRELWEAVPNRGNSAVVGVLATGNKGNLKNLHNRASPIYQFWDEHATKLEQPATRNGVEPLPNMVSIGAEDRFIQPLRRDDLFELAPEASFRFLARYEPSEKKPGHVENSMAALLAIDPERFRAIADDLSRVLPQLRLLGRADPKTRRPLVRLQSGVEVTLEQLSAGERAAVIALFTVARWLTQGGVVMIDEPELHQHISLMRTNLAVIERFAVQNMEGQLIVASHAPEVWDHFRVGRRMIDLDLPSEDAAR
ncbi:hypothetical protein [Sorangium sp. So ce131]|uniref:hypothetical protein n=1 Tax=Sorangium sp. So ce131 TaxID=3133282 RepID=UPI003F5E1150